MMKAFSKEVRYFLFNFLFFSIYLLSLFLSLYFDGIIVYTLMVYLFVLQQYNAFRQQVTNALSNCPNEAEVEKI